jgi:hypothetical protein
MRINLNNISDEFCVDSRIHPVIGEVILITPGFEKHKWSASELHLRSLMCRPDGTIICSGFPKFRNYGEDASDDILTRHSIVNQQAVYAEKLDGSLIIRSVIDNTVCFRTRGSHHLGEFEPRVMEVIYQKCKPEMLDPNYGRDGSYLFEFTSPSNRIIVSYNDSNLHALGRMKFGDNHLPYFESSPEIVKSISNMFGAAMGKFFDLPPDPNGVISVISNWKNAEGVVVWCPQPTGRMHLAKIKAAEYIRLHSLKYHLTNEKVRQFCWAKNINTVEDFASQFNALGIDWECVSFVEPIVIEFLQRKEYYTNLIKSLCLQIDQENLISKSRKEIALRLKEITADNPELFNVGIRYATGDRSYLENASDALILNVSIASVNNFKLEAINMAEQLVSGKLKAPDE